MLFIHMSNIWISTILRNDLFFHLSAQGMHLLLNVNVALDMDFFQHRNVYFNVQGHCAYFPSVYMTMGHMKHL